MAAAAGACGQRMTNSRRGGANADFLPLRQVWLFFSDKPAVLFRVFGVLFDFLHPDFIRVVHAELEQGGVGEKFVLVLNSGVPAW